MSQIQDAYGLRYEAVDNHDFSRWGFSAVDDREAWRKTREYAEKVGHSQTLNRSMPNDRTERVPNPDLPQGRWDK